MFLLDSIPNRICCFNAWNRRTQNTFKAFYALNSTNSRKQYVYSVLLHFSSCFIPHRECKDSDLIRHLQRFYALIFRQLSYILKYIISGIWRNDYGLYSICTTRGVWVCFRLQSFDLSLNQARQLHTQMLLQKYIFQHPSSSLGLQDPYIYPNSVVSNGFSGGEVTGVELIGHPEGVWEWNLSSRSTEPLPQLRCMEWPTIRGIYCDRSPPSNTSLCNGYQQAIVEARCDP